MASLVVSGDTSGAITIAAPAVAGTNTLTLPASTGTLVVTGGAQTVQFAAGTVSAPSITFTGDTNTGIFSPAADTIAFTEGGAESMRIDSSGNLLVGGTSTAPFSGTSGLGVTRATNPAIYISQTQSTGGYTAKDYVNYIAADGALAWYDTTALSERMRITSGGYLKVSNNGTYDDATGTYHEFNQNANGNTFVIKNSNASFTGTVFNIQATRNTTNGSYNYIVGSCPGVATRFVVADSGNVTNTNNSYGAISDVKLKENIVDATPKLEDLCKVKVRRYNLKSDPEHKQIGVVAQELEEVFAGLVETIADKDAENNDLGTTTKQVKYSVFVPMLIKAIQELNAKVEAQAVRIAELEGAK
jgi:hypothetical protein